MPPAGVPKRGEFRHNPQAVTCLNCSGTADFDDQPTPTCGTRSPAESVAALDDLCRCRAVGSRANAPSAWRCQRPVEIATAELLRWRRRRFVRVRSNDGVEGIAVGSERLEYLWPPSTQRVLPFLVGRDVRNVECLVDEVTRHEGNYKLSGLPFWSCLAAAEMAIFDLLGKQREVGGGTIRRRVGRSPVHLFEPAVRDHGRARSGTRGVRFAETLTRAVKLQIWRTPGRRRRFPRPH